MDRSLPASINDNRSTVKEAPPLKGSQWLNDAETNLKLVGQMIDEASQDQEGYGDDAVRLALGGLKNVGHVANAPVIKQGLQVAGALPWAAGQGMGAVLEHGFGVDPRYGHIAGELGDIAVGGGALKIGSKLARKGAKKALTKAGDYLHPLVAGMGGTGQAWATAGLKVNPLKASRLVSKHKDNIPFIRELENRTVDMYKHATKHGGSLDKYPGTRTIELPDGRKYRYEPSGKTGDLKFSWKALDKADAAATKRSISLIPDNKTLKAHLGSEKAVQAYNDLGNKVRSQIKKAITEANKNLSDADKISLEHIFDVQHYGRMKIKTSKFSGQGADELGNLTILKGRGSAGNYATGAKARTMDSGDAFIDAIQNNKFIDYTKTTSDFKAHNLAEKVNNFTKNDWKQFTDIAIKNPDKNIHDVLVDFVSGKKINPTQWSELRKRNIPIDVKLFGKSEWKVGDAKVTWYPNKNNPLKGRGQIDILDQASNTNPKGVKALIKDFNDAIKEFPSGTKVELNPMWKDAKRRSIYENYVFKNNPNIKPNPDDTLGWIYTAP